MGIHHEYAHFIKRQKKVNKHVQILCNITANANKPWESKFNSLGSNETGGKRDKVQ